MKYNYLLHTVAIRRTVCNNLLQSVARMATLYVIKQENLRYKASPFAPRYVTICYISSRCYVPCLIKALPQMMKSFSMCETDNSSINIVFYIFKLINFYGNQQIWVVLSLNRCNINIKDDLRRFKPAYDRKSRAVHTSCIFKNEIYFLYL
jgi:hypothetical protein